MLRSPRFMAIAPKDFQKLELAMQADSQHYRLRYQPGVEHVGIYRIFSIWPDRLKEIVEVDGEWRENGVRFLEANPRYFRSGYDKAQLLRHLKRAKLSVEHKKRLGKILLAAVQSNHGVEFRQYCQLAARVVSTEVMTALMRLAKSDDAATSRRARWMLDHATQEAIVGVGR